MHSSIITMDVCKINSAAAVPLEMLHVEDDDIVSGILKVLCAVRPFLSRIEEVPDDAVAMAIWPCDRT